MTAVGQRLGKASFIRFFLEFARVFLGPSFHYDFLVGVKFDGVAVLAVHVTKKAVLPSAKGEVRHGSGHADVDADVSRGRLVAKSASRTAAGSKQRSLIAKRILLQE